MLGEEPFPQTGLHGGDHHVLKDELVAIRKRCQALPVRDPRSPEEILGYDANGLPH